jgi:type I restriction enzyme M protein
MAPNLFYGTGLAPCIIILKANKSKEMIKKIQFINAETFFKRGRNQNTLEDEHVSKILKLYKNFKPVDGFSSLSTEIEINANNYNLNIPLYVTPSQNRDQLSLEQCVKNLKESK